MRKIENLGKFFSFPSVSYPPGKVFKNGKRPPVDEDKPYAIEMARKIL